MSISVTFQEKATKWTENHEIDGLTTNGVLIMHPRGDFCGGNATCGPWRETSVGGAVFSLRESRSAQQKVCEIMTQIKLYYESNRFRYSYSILEFFFYGSLCRLNS